METKCSIGKIVKDDCNLLTYTRKTGFLQLNSLHDDEREIILWRCGLLEKGIDVGKGTICMHHSFVYGKVFERHVSVKCCNAFNTHRRKVKGQRVITLAKAYKLKKIGYNVIPGWKICKNCYEKIPKESITEQVEDDLEFEESFQGDLEEGGDSVELSREEFNSSLVFSGLSPLKLHGLRKPNQISAAIGKLRRLREHYEEMAARAIGVDVDNIASSSTAASDVLRRDAMEKAAELDRLHFLLKEKLIESSKEEKVQILTLAPDSWSREQAAQFFNVSEHMVRTARKLKKEKGILS